MEASGGLTALLGDSEARRFVRDHWPDSLFHGQVDLSAAPHLFARGEWADPCSIDALYGGPIEVTRGVAGQHRVEGAAVSTWVRDFGVAVRLCDVRTHVPGALEWLSELEAELGLADGSALCSAFVNPPGLGLRIHCDPSDHLLVHVAGEKRIRVMANPSGPYVSASHAPAVRARPRDCLQYAQGLPDWKQAPGDAPELVLRPGSVLFMPRGTYHETVGGADGVSTSLVVAMAMPSRADLLAAYLRDYLVQDPRWRAPVSGVQSRQCPVWRAHEVHMTELLHELAERLPGLRVASVLARGMRGGSPEGLAGLRFARDPSVEVDFVQLEGKPSGVRIARRVASSPVQTFDFGPAVLGLVGRLCELTRPTSFSELMQRFGDWEEDAIVRILRFLVRKGVLIELAVDAYE